jgi:DNA repair exonuclease SbcCD nuclease subunit
MTETLRIAHCSDIHLDPESRGDNARNGRQRAAFATALQAMAAHRPDLLLLAGDLFDSNAASAETIRWAMEALGALPFPVIMIPGNHDCMEEGAIYRWHDFNRIPNVRLLAAEQGEIARLPDLGVAAWGRGMVEHTPDYQPLAGRPGRPNGCRWYLGLAHGLFVPHGGDTHRSSPIHIAEIESADCDYLALGHHHAAMELVSDKATAAYSGSPTDSIGRGATYVIAELAVTRPPAVAVHLVDAAA